MLCAIWYRLYNLKIVRNIRGGLLPLVRITLLHGCFFKFLKLRQWYQTRKAFYIKFDTIEVKKMIVLQILHLFKIFKMAL